MCNTPINIKNPASVNRQRWEPSRLMVPCGKCELCIKKRSNDWTLRLRYHQKEVHSSYFVTLTYTNCPRTQYGLNTLRKSDLQNFFKRLRQREGSATQISYYACGEYGSEGQRPHYHIILFNVNEKRNIMKAWTIDNKLIGHVDIGEVAPASISYVTGYIGKKIGIPVYEQDDRLKEFSLMSKKSVQTTSIYRGNCIEIR